MKKLFLATDTNGTTNFGLFSNLDELYKNVLVEWHNIPNKLEDIRIKDSLLYNVESDFCKENIEYYLSLPKAYDEAWFESLKDGEIYTIWTSNKNKIIDFKVIDCYPRPL